MTTQPLTLGRTLIMANNLFLASGSFIADWNETHVKNPRWPPHARFHNGQTMSMSLFLGAASAYFAFRACKDKAMEVDSVWSAAMWGSVYTVTGLSAILYPGAKGMDPEFGEGFPQFWIFGGSLVMNWIGYWLEMKRLGV